MVRPRVQLEKLVVSNFRNLVAVDIDPHGELNVVLGENGMGKTNLLEAVYLLGALRSFRTSSRREMIRHGVEGTKVTGTFGESSAGMNCEVSIGRGGRRVRIDGKNESVVKEHFNKLPMVLFHPGNMTLAQGGPSERRRFLDRALYQARPAYADAHQTYRRALRSRNRLLRDRPGDSRSQRPFEAQLAESGSRIVGMRAEIVEGMKAFYRGAFARMSGSGEAGIEYRPSLSGSERDFEEAIEEGRAADEQCGHTRLGPHADDLELEVEGRSARRYASQGQQRAVVLSLKVAEAKELARVTGRIPLLLLDDVSSELDSGRNRRLFELLTEVGAQVFVTTTGEEHVAVDGERKVFELVGGEVEGIREE
ncbi:MAG: DNA replication/repair protein RecF [Polyangia bacterium]